MNPIRFGVSIRHIFLTTILIAAFALQMPIAAQSNPPEASDSALVVRGIQQKNLWEKTMFLALQGLANRNAPNVYLFINGKEVNDRVWLDWYRKQYGLKTKTVDDPYKLFNYEWSIKGYVLMDPDAKHSANVAMNFASALNLLPVTETILENHRDQLPNLDVQIDLTGRFQDASARDVYQWAARHQWNNLNYNRKFVANCMAPDQDKKPFFQSQHIRDFIVARNGFVFELSSNQNKHPDEYQLKANYLSDMPNWGYLFGWHIQRDNEAQHVELATRHKQMVLCSNTASNFSFHQHMQPSQPDYQQANQRRRTNQVTLEENKIYLTFYYSDGDSLNWVSRGAHGRRWRNRGDIPMGWEIQPLLRKFAPGMLDYFYRTATDKDLLIASASGLGYNHPQMFPDKSLTTYLQMSRAYFQELDLRLLIALTNYANRPGGVDRSTRQTYGRILGDTLMGVFEGYTTVRADRTLENNLVWMPTLLPHTTRRKRIPSYQNFKEIVSDNPQRPLFIPYHVNKGHMTYEDAVQFVASVRDEYGKQVKVVRPDEFILAYAIAEQRKLNKPVKIDITKGR